MGGTIHVQKGKPGFNKELNYLTGSKEHNLSSSISGDDYKNYFVGFEGFRLKFLK